MYLKSLCHDFKNYLSNNYFKVISPFLSPLVHLLKKHVCLPCIRILHILFLSPDHLCEIEVPPCSSDGKEPACNVGDLGLIPGFGRLSGGHSNLLQ